MNKSDLSARVANDASLSRAHADAVVQSVFAAITDALVVGELVTIAGVGTFTTRTRASRQDRNPRTSERITNRRLERSFVQGRKDAQRRRQLASGLNTGQDGRAFPQAPARVPNSTLASRANRRCRRR